MEVLREIYDEDLVLITRNGVEFVYYIEKRGIEHRFNAPITDFNGLIHSSFQITRTNTGWAFRKDHEHHRDIMVLGYDENNC